MFPEAHVASLWQAPVWQLWLDDLLARSLLAASAYHSGEFVVLAPAQNAACTAVVAAYNALIAPASIRLITLEEYVAAAAAVTDAAWWPTSPTVTSARLLALERHRHGGYQGRGALHGALGLGG